MSIDPFVTRLAETFQAMDDEYAKVAGEYGFHCRGCEDNCCMTHFHHHTHVEYLYFAEGMRALDTSAREDVLRRARYVLEGFHMDGDGQEPPRLMCPLNEDGLCLLYDHRPMICRLHGLPHEIHYPGGNVHTGPGCAAFHARVGDRSYIRFDRTPFYTAMAAIERDYKTATGTQGPFRQTIAEMLAIYGDENNQPE